MAATLVPSGFFDASAAVDCLAEVAEVGESDKVLYTDIPQYGACLVYSVSGGEEDSLPELYYVLNDLPKCREYNKIVASFRDGKLSLGIAQGAALLLANEYPAMDFTTAEYFIFLALKSLQLNPEVSTIHFRSELLKEDEMSLYRYFRTVESL